MVAACWLLTPILEPRFDYNYYNLQRLDRGTSAEPTIVLLGSSKTRSAVEFDDLMSRRLSALVTPAKIVRITKSAANIDDFAGVLRRIEEVRRAAVLIESGLATLEASPFRKESMAQKGDWRRQVHHSLAGLLPAAMIAKLSPEN